jgi:hypothetical protein
LARRTTEKKADTCGFNGVNKVGLISVLKVEGACEDDFELPEWRTMAFLKRRLKTVRRFIVAGLTESGDADAEDVEEERSAQ